MRTIAVLNQKGGAGKTTLATNIAAAAHLSGQRVLLLDLDPQKTAYDWYHQRSDSSLLAGLNVIAVDVRLRPAQFKHLAAGYDVVVIDTPPKLEVATQDPKARCELLAAACLADVAVIPVEPEYFNLWACDATFALLSTADEIREQLEKSPVERLVVLNKARDSERLTKMARESMVDTTGYRDELRVHRAVLFKHVQGAGETVHVKPESAPAQEMNQLWIAASGGVPGGLGVQGARGLGAQEAQK